MQELWQDRASGRVYLILMYCWLHRLMEEKYLAVNILFSELQIKTYLVAVTEVGVH
jgi:hypothetical protein